MPSFFVVNKHDPLPAVHLRLCLESFAFCLKVLICIKKVRVRLQNDKNVT